MNLIIDGLPNTVEIAGRAVPIETDFRVGMLVELMISDDELTDEQKLLGAIKIYFPGEDLSADDTKDIVDAILWFHRCGQLPASGGAESISGPLYSYDYDADMIYAAFMQAYGIDLATIDLHWWQFRALFRNIPEECTFAKALGYRAADIPADAPKKEREHMQRMKEIYALPKSEKQQKLETDLSALLMAGGNPSALFDQ